MGGIVYFGNVQLIQPDHIAWNRLIYQRNNRNYELLLNLCYLVLNGMLQTTEDGTYRLLAFSEEHDEDFPDGEPFMIGGNRIGVKALDLNQEFSAIAGQLEGILGEYF